MAYTVTVDLSNVWSCPLASTNPWPWSHNCKRLFVEVFWCYNRISALTCSSAIVKRNRNCSGFNEKQSVNCLQRLIFPIIEVTDCWKARLLQTLVLYPRPHVVTCTLRIWLREIGFALSYGALMLKTWRWVELDHGYWQCISLTRYIEVEMQAVKLFIVRVTSPSNQNLAVIIMESTVIMSAGGGPAVRLQKVCSEKSII